MKFLALTLLLSSTAFAKNSFDFRVARVTCSGAPNWIRFSIQPKDLQNNFEGSGTENYLDFTFDCAMNEERTSITCKAPEGVAATISIDENDVASATFEGQYHKSKTNGCILSV